MKKMLLLVSAELVCVSVLAEDACDRLGWQLAVHAYTFKNFSIYECIDKTAGLGLEYIAFPAASASTARTKSKP
jgi:hypothetical protein